jgi:subtilase family serine protease
MTRKPQAFPGLSILLVLMSLLAFSLPQSASAQTPNLKSRIALPVDETSLVTLKGNTHPYATAQFDQGAAPASLPLHRMLLVLKRSDTQEAALDELLDEQQNAASPNYHQWLTPQQFGAQFGPAQQDVQIITSWLQSHGFEVTGLSKGGILIEFSGSASQVQDAFHTAIHSYAVSGKTYYANSQDPQIPTALAGVVAGVRSLHNFPARAMNHSAGTFRRDPQTGQIQPVGKLPIPQFNPDTQCSVISGPCELLGPYDIATIYNVNPLWSASTPIDGTGQTIAISGETDINPTDWNSFWAMFGVTAPKGKLNIIVNGVDPGFQSDEAEADIDTQWSSAVAKGATIDYVESQSTETTLGVDLSAEYIVDNNLAPVMSESYGICELFIGTTGNQFYNALWQQAAAQGISVFISSGDQGSSVCDDGQEFAQYGLSVNGFGSTPYNVAVGGTDFNDLTTTATYWNATNSTTQSNAKSYIPEMTWNDTCTNQEIFSYVDVTSAEQSCNNSDVQQSGFLGVAGGSGGASNCTTSTGQSPSGCSGGYAKPSWQTGSGVPKDGKRDLPDVSLFASNGFNGTFYLVCQSDSGYPCSLGGGTLYGYGGTSVSSPEFAGIMALINQKTGERQGNPNYVFYKMAATSSNVCSSSSPTSSCIFYDTPAGSTIAMPCANGSPNCTVKTSGDQYGVLTGFATTAGYDEATGLGSVNVANLVNQWSTYSGAFKGSKFSAFTVGPPATITHGQSIAVSATVVPQSGTGTPTGSVVLIANNGTSASQEQAAPQTLPLTNGSLPAGTTTDFLPGGKSYSLTAHYSGDATFAPADSTPVTVTVNPESSKSLFSLVTYDSNGAVVNPNATTIQYGNPYFLLRADVTNSSGTLCSPNGVPQYDCPTGSVTLKDTYSGSTSSLAGGPFALNTQAYAEDQAAVLGGGTHSIVASYTGDSSFNSSTATAATITVTKATTNINFNGPPTATVGSPVTFTANINSSAILPTSAPTSAYPADNVQFFDGSKVIAGTVTYSSSQTSTGVEVSASLTTSALTPGAHSITAQFTGDNNYSASLVSNVTALSVQYSTNASTLTASTKTAQAGSNITFTFTLVPSQTGGPAPTGEVLFTCSCSQEYFPDISSNFQAQWMVSVLAAGTDVITVQYGGDANYAATTQTVTVTVNALASTTSVSTSNAAISSGTSVTLTSLVAAAKSGGPAPTGTVQFGASTASGNPGTPLGNAVTLASGQATLTTTSIPSGTQFISASYSGDTNYATSVAYTAEVVTGQAAFTMAATPGSVTVTAPGGFASTSVLLTAQGGYSGTVQLTSASCAGLPAETTCSFNPSTLTLSSSAQTANTTVSFQTTAASNVVPVSDQPNGTHFGASRKIVFTVGFVIAAAMGFLLIGITTPRRRGVVLAALTVAAVAAFASCGGGSGGGGGGTHNSGTPQGSYQVTITASSNVTPAPTATVTLTVN